MRILQGARLLLALILAANGLTMLAAPHFWYQTTPGVTGTGPLNVHFVRDIGAAYLVAASGFFWMWKDSQAWRAALAGSAFLTIHALIHLGEMLAGSFDLHHLLRDLPGVFLLPVFALWLSLTPTKENNHAEMVRPAPARRL